MTGLEEQVSILGEEIRLLKSLVGLSGPRPAGILAAMEDRAYFALLAAVLGSQGSVVDAFLRVALAARAGHAQLRVVRDRQSVPAGANYAFVYRPKANRVLRVLGGLNVIALRHIEGLSASITVDGDLQPVVAADLSVADLPLDSHVFGPIRTDLTIQITNSSTEAVGVAIDTHLVDLEPVLHDDELRVFLDRLWASLRGVGR